MFSLCKKGNYLSLNIRLPRFILSQKEYKFYQYQITYLRPNGQLITQMRSNLPRVTDFRDFESHSISEYIGCSNGFGWLIKNIKVVECNYRS